MKSSTDMNQRKEYLVSVVIPVFNVSKYIKRCLDSVVSQTYANIEILVVDDKGQDDSIDKVLKYEDDRITIITHDENRGLPAARNTGIRHAKGDFILFLDSDDYIKSCLIEKCVCRQKVSDVDCVVFNTTSIDESGNKSINQWMNNFIDDEVENKTIDDVNAHVLIGWDVAAWSKMIRLSYLKEKNVYFIEDQPYFEDYYFSAKLYTSGARISNIKERLHYYFKRSDSDSKSITQMKSPLITLYRSKMMRDVCLLLEDVNPEYKNIFYPVFLSFYKLLLNEAFNFKVYKREVYDNIRRTFKGISELSLVETADIYELDLAFILDRYDYDTFHEKYNSIWIFTRSDLLKLLPAKIRHRFQEWTSISPSNVSVGPRLVLDSCLFLLLCLFNRTFPERGSFVIQLKDFHIINRFGSVNYPREVGGIERIARIFKYVLEGEKAGEQIDAEFDAERYFSSNPDLMYAKIGLYSHYLLHGRFENRM